MSPTSLGFALASMLAASTPVGTGAADAPVRAGRPGDAARTRVVAAMRRHLDRPFRGDCSAFVRRVYAEAGAPLRLDAGARSGTEALVRPLRRTHRPRPGDLAYFHRTHDRDPAAGRGGNLFTHVAIVESVRGRRVTLIHRSNTGVERLRIDRSRPGDASANDPLRRTRPSDPPGQPYLASQLLGGFVSPFPPARGSTVAARARPPVARRR